VGKGVSKDLLREWSKGATEVLIPMLAPFIVKRESKTISKYPYY